MPRQLSEECCEMTYCAIGQWYKHIFEKLGWMVLAKAHKNDYKVEHYVKTIEHLHASIRSKIKTIKDSDKKADLKIMMKNVEHLLKHAKRDFM